MLIFVEQSLETNRKSIFDTLSIGKVFIVHIRTPKLEHLIEEIGIEFLKMYEVDKLS